TETAASGEVLRSPPTNASTSRSPSAGTTVRSGRGERPQHFHDEDGLLVAFERGAQLGHERAEDVLVRPEHLRAHAVGDHLQATMRIQAVDEVLNRRDELPRQ